ncbi:oxygen-independent coproporphyrinogen III oxidase [Sphingomonas melonis]|nr:oxygen-independent coproporphyrinogen III oxidase [Sphingomonas melonis]
MWTFHPDLLARPVPRYTSYPTAAEFGREVGHGDMAEALDAVATGAVVSLYVHIPYCHAICWYCGCNTAATNRTGRLEAYLTRLDEEITLVASRLAGRGSVGRIAFGGGSPNAMSPASFRFLVERLLSRFECTNPVLSVELDPRGFGRDWAMALRSAGVTRASLGVQTFDERLQTAIGRLQPEDDIRRTVEMLREAEVRSINFDLMYGLPGQEDADLAATLETALELDPDRMAVFGYAHVPGLIPRQRRIDARALPGVEARFGQAALAHRRLTDAGYLAVGFDHFAKPADDLARAAVDGTLRRNFQGFTEDQADVLIGLGASAISAFPDRFLQAEKNTGLWHAAVGTGRFPVARGTRRSSEDQLRGKAIEAILCHGEADLAGVPQSGAMHARLVRFAEVGLIQWEGSRIALRNGALPYARVIASALDVHRHADVVRFSSAV